LTLAQTIDMHRRWAREASEVLGRHSVPPRLQ
jgi:hypothetical protein